MRHVAFLRAVNVGGRKVEMARLRTAVEAAGFDRVATYLASGNLFFDSPRRSRAAIVKRLEAALLDTFGFEVPVALRTLAELEALVAADPFAGRERTDDVRFLVNFHLGPVPELPPLPAVSPKGQLELVAATAGETFVVAHVVDGRWGTERWLDTGPTTTRFWHTTGKILDAARR